MQKAIQDKKADMEKEFCKTKHPSKKGIRGGVIG